VPRPLPTLTGQTPRDVVEAFHRLHGDLTRHEAVLTSVQLAVSTAPRALTLAQIRDGLQASGGFPLNTTALIPGGAGGATGAVLEGTHADRLNLAASALKPGVCFLETDRNAVYVVVDTAGTWQVIVSYDIGSSVASRPADLGGGDAKFLFHDKETGLTWRWSGAQWKRHWGFLLDTFANRPVAGADVVDGGVIFVATNYGDHSWIYINDGAPRWLLLEGVGGPMPGTIFSADQRPAGLTANDVGFLFRAADANDACWRWNGANWIYLQGTGSPLAVTLNPSTLPALTANDAGFQVWSTDYGRGYTWGGAAWAEWPTNPDRYAIALFLNQPDLHVGAGWALCDGSTVLRSTTTAGTTNLVTPDLQTAPAFLRANTVSGASGTQLANGADENIFDALPYIRT
jgi:hypothetical protein